MQSVGKRCAIAAVAPIPDRTPVARTESAISEEGELHSWVADVGDFSRHGEITDCNRLRLLRRYRSVRMATESTELWYPHLLGRLKVFLDEVGLGYTCLRHPQGKELLFRMP